MGGGGCWLNLKMQATERVTIINSVLLGSLSYCTYKQIITKDISPALRSNFNICIYLETLKLQHFRSNVSYTWLP